MKRVREEYRRLTEWLRRVVTHPVSELSRWQRATRYGYDLFRFGTRQLAQDRAPQMAAALAFRTLFSLLPVLVVATVTARALMGQQEFLSVAERMLRALGLYEIEIAPAVDTDPLTGAEVVESVSLGAWLHGLFNQAIDLNLAALGWVGLGVLIYSAISLVVTVETSFNTIYRAPEGRSWHRRVPLYWFILTISPVAIGLSLFIDNQFDLIVQQMHTWQWVLVSVNALWGFSVTWLVVFVAYLFIPNTYVSLRSALMGGFVAAIIVEILIESLGAYFENAVSLSRLYGSLGLIPLFMFWVYLMWLAILFGLEFASTLQMLHGRKPEELEQRPPQTGLVDPAAVVTVMEQVAMRFARGTSVTTREVADNVHLSETTVSKVMERLAAEGLVHRVERPEGAFSLALPPDEIPVERLLQVGFALVDEGQAPPKDSLIQRLRKAQLEAASKTSLAALARA